MVVCWVVWRAACSVEKMVARLADSMVSAMAAYWASKKAVRKGVHLVAYSVGVTVVHLAARTVGVMAGLMAGR